MSLTSSQVREYSHGTTAGLQCRAAVRKSRRSMTLTKVTAIFWRIEVNNQLADNKEIARQFLEALGNCDLKGALSHVSSEMVIDTKGTSIVSGRREYNEVVQLLTGISQALAEPLRWTWLNITAEDDRVAIECTSETVLKGNVPYGNQYHFLFMLRDGKIVELREYMCTKKIDEVLVPAMALA